MKLKELMMPGAPPTPSHTEPASVYGTCLYMYDVIWNLNTEASYGMSNLVNDSYTTTDSEHNISFKSVFSNKARIG